MIFIYLSFLLDNLVGKLLGNNSVFFPLFTMLSLIFLYPSFKRDNRYYLISFAFGFLYDIAYTDTLFLNAFVFLLLVIFIKFYFNKWGFDFITVFILNLLLIIFYRVIVYLVLILIGYSGLDFELLFESIYRSFLINIVFVIVSYKISLVKFK